MSSLMCNESLDEAAIFNASRQILDAQARQRYLQEACGNDSCLLARVVALLRVHVEQATFLETPALSNYDAATLIGSNASNCQIGPYHLVEKIGEGGFGVVFKAEQQQPIRRVVAVKILKPGMDSAQIVSRFEAERDALALMDHPGIARVLDGGVTPFGRPFFVMEFVAGVPITEFCDRSRLPAAERLKLFIEVCGAIEHAHHKGVIHRDIKPSNVLVTQADGRPSAKVIDFGVAKATAPQHTERTLFTSFGQIIGTPAYMSPEQAEMGPDIDTRSDIYSLGILLYELLTGTTPLDENRVRAANLADVQRLIREEEPQKPSARMASQRGFAGTIASNRSTDPTRLARLLSGDLDWIVMKAIEKDRNRRYASAGAFANDIERYLRGEPISARPPSRVYRLRKAMQRNRVLVLTTAIVAAALISGSLIATWQAINATRARGDALRAAAAESAAKDIASAKEREARAVLDFVNQKILAAARPKGLNGGLGTDVTLRAAIDAAVPAVETTFKDQPLIEARLRVTLGNSFLDLGDGKAAGEQFEPALAIYTKLQGPNHADTIGCKNQLGSAYGMQGRTREWVALCEELLPIFKAKFGLDGQPTLSCLNNLGRGYFELGDYATAMRIHTEVVAIKKAKFGPGDRSTLLTMVNLANVYHKLERYDEALTLRLETLELQKANLGPEDYGTLMTAHNIGNNYRRLGRHAEAFQIDSANLVLRKNTLGLDHPDTLSTMWSVAIDLLNLDRGTEAVPILDECLERGVGKRIHANFSDVADLRLRYFEKAKNAEECRKTAEIWEKQQRTDPGSLYQAAVCRAVTAAVLLATDESESTSRLSIDEANEAMNWLRKAIAAGFKDSKKLREEENFRILQDREEFKELLATLAESSSDE